VPLEVTGEALDTGEAVGAGATAGAGPFGSGGVHTGPPDGPTGMGVGGMTGGDELPQPSTVAAASATVERTRTPSAVPGSRVGIVDGDRRFSVRIVN
jgi:hypothetical protein